MLHILETAKPLPLHRPKLQRTLLIGAIILMAGLLCWVTLYWQPGERPGLARQPLALSAEPTGGDFLLQSLQGPMRLQDFRGQVVIVYFGYTWCPDICPTSLGITSLALDELAPQELAQVQGIFVSVDPERDTLERLKQYTEFFHPKILGVTGSSDELADVASQYGVAYHKVEQQSEIGYAVDHSANVYLINRRGDLVEILPHGTAPEELLARLRKLLAEAG